MNTTLTLPKGTRDQDTIPSRPAVEERSAARRVSFNLALVFLFFRVSFLHELLLYELGSNFFILYIVAVPLLLTFVLSGGLQRAFRKRPTIYWTAFVIWMTISAPFSYWRTGSVEALIAYLKHSFLILLITAGLAVTLRECRKLLFTVAAAGAVNLLMGLAYGADATGRFRLEFSMISNANDYAAHVIFVIPVFVYLFARTDRGFPIRLSALAATVIAVFLILSTGSRGALFALSVEVLILLLMTSWRIRIVAAAGLLAATFVLLGGLVPDRAAQRLKTLWSDEAAASNAGALESVQLRVHLFKESIRLTLENPITGVGLGQFENRLGAERGDWRATHNAYTQVASEIGLPGFLFFMLAIISSYRLVRKTLRLAKKESGFEGVQTAAQCLTAAFIGFGVAAGFLSLAYHFYFPLLSGLAACLFSATDLRIRATNR